MTIEPHTGALAFIDSGPGLPTAKRLVEAHDGQIAIGCPPAGGTAIVVRLPIGAA